MKKIIVLGICLFIGVLVYSKSDELIIPDDAIRVRIIANSNSISDLYKKNKLKEDIKFDLYNLIKEASSKKEADGIIKNNINEIKKILNNKISDYKIDYGLNYFPRKIYKGIIYPEGEYESLVITLGKGYGDNWWCVLYPPICMIEDNNDYSDVEYRLAISDVLKKLT